MKGRTITSWPSLQTDVRNAGGTWVDEEVHVDQGLVTSRKPDDLPAFNAKVDRGVLRGPARGQAAARGVDRRLTRAAARSPAWSAIPPAPGGDAGRMGDTGRMPRSIWTGAISFGLVTVPVKLYSAVSRKTVRFHQLNGQTGVRIQQKRVDPSTGDEVAYEDIVKGYEIAPDRYVIIEPGELEALDPKKTKTIEIEDFVDPRRDRPDLLRPPVLPRARRGRREALPAAARGDARDAARSRSPRSSSAQKENLVAIRPMEGDVLGMATMIFADEVVDPDRIDDLDAARRHRDQRARARRSPSSSSSRSRASSSPTSTTTPTARRSSRSSSARPPARRSPCSRPGRGGRRSRCRTSWPR